MGLGVLLGPAIPVLPDFSSYSVHFPMLVIPSGTPQESILSKVAALGIG